MEGVKVGRKSTHNFCEFQCGFCPEITLNLCLIAMVSRLRRTTKKKWRYEKGSFPFMHTFAHRLQSMKKKSIDYMLLLAVMCSQCAHISFFCTCTHVCVRTRTTHESINFRFINGCFSFCHFIHVSSDVLCCASFAFSICATHARTHTHPSVYDLPLRCIKIE